MNAPFPNFAAAQRNVDRALPDFASEAERQEKIVAAAKDEAKQIWRALPANDALALKICDDIPSYLDTITIVQIVRLSIAGDMDKVRELILQSADAAVQREAEGIAEQRFE